jgi:starch phosphorylase
MNILGVIHRYANLKKMNAAQRKEVVPRVIIFGGKAAPGYYIAKLVIKLINSVGEVVNNDKDIGDLLKVVFIPDYNVSVAEVIIPANDISQHISTAGTEASGTSNMKFVLNGGIILGTVDGANIEIYEEIGDDQIFLFGARAEQVEDLRHVQRYRNVPMNPELQAVIHLIENGTFGESHIFQPLINTITVGKDYYLISVDFASYLESQELVDEAFKDKKAWAQKSILCTARMGKFSSDRAIKEYAEDIWNIDVSAVMMTERGEGSMRSVGSGSLLTIGFIACSRPLKEVVGQGLWSFVCIVVLNPLFPSGIRIPSFSHVILHSPLFCPLLLSVFKPLRFCTSASLSCQIMTVKK